MGLGVPFNIVQYSILTHMMAKVTNHIATEFVSIDDFVYEDFEIDGYDSHPIIKMPVAV